MGDYNDAFMRSQNAAVQARTKAQNRANVMQLKLVLTLNPHSLSLFDFLVFLLCVLEQRVSLVVTLGFIWAMIDLC